MMKYDGVARGHRRVPRPASGHRRHSRGDPRGGGDAAPAVRGALGRDRARDPPEVRGDQPNRLVQGPGARVLEVEGSFDLALRITRELADSYPVELVNSVNPDRIEGQKTCAFEICDVLGRAPDLHLMPVGNAGNITSHWKGYTEEREAAAIDRLPRMFGFQAEGAAPIVRGEPVDAPDTVASAIRIGNPASWQGAVAAADESGGDILAVSDEEILGSYDGLAREGLFCEPASA